MLKRAVAIAESRGFELVHGIVDSMWLRKPDATVEEYRQLCGVVRGELELPIGFEGRYKWIVFLNSKVDPRVPVLNRYYGVFQDGTLKVRGIELRRHDTPEVVRKCQADMLAVLSEAVDSDEFRVLIPKALRTLKEYVSLLRAGSVPVKDLVIRKNLSQNPEEYTNLVPQAVAAGHLVAEGGSVHAGQGVNYVLAYDRSGIKENRALPVEFVDENTQYDSESYVDLLLSSTENILLPFGYTVKKLRTGLQ